MSGRVSPEVEAALVGELAGDVGRLRRQLAALIENFDGSYSEGLVDRIANRVLWLDAWCREPASVRYRSGLTVEESLAQVDREAAALRLRLGATDPDDVPELLPRKPEKGRDAQRLRAPKAVRLRAPNTHHLGGAP